ncbi:hypothetical protein MA13_contig00002-0129 [Edwardsiella piscicida]|nr:hypothetical protein MA13_contig00002-0129 [Edwardsiella piscicida]
MVPDAGYRPPGKFGGAKRDRTADLLHAMQALSQLSYSPTFVAVPKPCVPYPLSLEKSGGAKRDRTADLLHAMQALSQLSYSPVHTASSRERGA